MKNMSLHFNAVIELDEDGNYIASVPAVPGCYSSGENFEEAMKNISEALALCLEEAEQNPEYAAQITYPNLVKNKVMSLVQIMPAYK